jgi:hypothetical protein
MTFQKLFVGTLAMVSITVGVVAGCGGDNGGGGDTFPVGNGKDAGEGGDGSGGSGDNGTICLLNDCDLDRDCKDCTGDRTVCNQKEHRCIACGADASGKMCGAGQYCTQYGDCVANGVMCPVDGMGNPTITCKTSADCGACDPKHQVCANSACVGCSTDDVTNCQSTDICTPAGACVAACPSSCTTDDDCGSCNMKGKTPATACNKHVCAACSATKPCAAGGACDLDHGTCTPLCGTNGRQTVGDATCSTDADCKGCKTTTACQQAIGGGGKCVVPATGCSDLGKGVLVLPAPFNEVTNLCSSDTDCKNVSAMINVGGIIRDITGISAVKDANISYSMHACANVTIKGLGGGGDGGSNGLSCGVCVPCKVDTDCTDIDIDKLAGDAFGPIGSIAAAILLDQVFGPNDHKIHMYCDTVADGYGVCVPCSDMLHACGDGKSTGTTSGKCDHDACMMGTPLDPSCDSSAKDVCAHDSYCCTDQWDGLCISEVDQYAKQQACTPVSCAYKDDGTYCTPASTTVNPGLAGSGFVCSGHSILGGTVPCQMAQQSCVVTDSTNIKSPAKTQAAGDGGTTIVCQ